MPPEARLHSFPRALAHGAIPAAWRTPLMLLAACWAMLFLAFAADWAAMAGQWWNTSTYNHILLIPAILVWLVHQRSGELAKIAPGHWWPGLAILAARPCCGCWAHFPGCRWRGSWAR